MRCLQQEWYTPAEVAIHNKPSDCWVILNGKVLNLTGWLQNQLNVCKCTKTCTCQNKNWLCEDSCAPRCACFQRGFFYCDGLRLAAKLIAYAGKEISHWFKEDDWVHYTHPIVGSSTPFHRHGPGYRQPVVPSTRWRPYEKPWWLDETMVMGKATAKARPIMITNTLSGFTVTLEVCSEETIYQIMLRYYPHNPHFMSYTWRYLGHPICLNKTLEENGILDERDLYHEVGLPETFHIPAILIYYNDDLTIDFDWSIIGGGQVCHCEHMDCAFPALDGR